MTPDIQPMALTAPAPALDIDEIPFSDLLLLLSPAAAAAAAAGDDANDNDRRRRRLLATVWAALGRGGTGLLAVAGVPRAASLRRRILPLARRLALMDHPSRADLLKKHGVGSDVSLKNPDRSVSSFAQLLRHDSGQRFHLPESMGKTAGGIDTWPNCTEEATPGVNVLGERNDDDDDDIENLGELFKELGLCMMELGILVARACDIVIGGNQLEQSITDYGSAKARLIHYHSELDNKIIRQSSTNKRRNLVNNAAAAVAPLSDNMDTSCYEGPGSGYGSNVRLGDGQAFVMSGEEKDVKDIAVQGHGSTISLVNLWQEWHYDYGVLTVLTTPLFLRSALGQEYPDSEECSLPDGHTHLQLFNKMRMFSVRCSEDSFIVQVGEAADILSGGKLRSTLHAVSRPLGLPNISRETFVVFLQPSWDKTLPCSGYSSANEDDSSDHMESAFRNDGSAGSCSEHILMQEVLKKIPPLSSRLKEGMTFAEFSRQTTKRYYGGGGIQQNN